VIGILLVDISKGSERQIIEGSCSEIKWSATGRFFAYVRLNPVRAENGSIAAYSDEQLYVYNIETGEKILVMSITGRSIEYLWSPVGDRIAFLCSSDNGIHLGLYVYDTMNDLTKLDSLPCVEVNFSWSPDGKMIAYPFPEKVTTGPPTWEAYSEDSDVYIMNSDGSDKTRITNTLYIEQYVKWLHDGKSIIVERFKNAPEPGYGGGETEVVILKLKKREEK
jgi:Tol biopolymer transport system component